MSETEQTTVNLIFSAAMQEFLEKGFKSASLRNIVKTAGATTGAFYGYYDSKEDLFEALVGEQYDYFMNCFCKAQQEFADSPPEKQPDNLSAISGECMHDMLLYAYEHLNEFKLILCRSEGTRFSKLIDKMVYMAYHSRHTGSFPEFLTSAECHTLWLVCRIVCGYIHCCLYSRLDVSAYERVQGCREYPKRAYAPYYRSAAWGNRKIWKRKTAKNSKYFQYRYRNISCTQATR